jgi:integrase
VDSGYVFQNASGGFIRPCRASELFRELAERCGLATTSLHNLRHTDLSWLVAAGVDIRTVAGVAGHSTPNVTLSIYAHLIPVAQAKAMIAIDERLATPRGRSS